MKLVHQRTWGDCAIASLSTFLGLEYANVLEVFKETTQRSIDEVGTYESEFPLLAQRLGKKIKKRKGKPKGRCVIVVKFTEFDNNHPISCVDSEWYHAVYFDGYRIFDPAVHGSVATVLTTEQYLEKSHCWFKESRWGL
jgi:hypothetical protein